ncbi:NADH dehydrogenase 1 alpha subcomplex subunit 12 [Hibiscus syriacus]|uniref:NADH dehydrogenase [ubiquinone] 1 alpha subcomplex subunit 12 n=1 Tax=Hibiscus syriacus TaxID=106335 RepID=A0A6A2ZMI5_HIBSY|nr:NADH dehydrogenase 1 alpha subcomplex subunit 12 [Hibiscus syriacus]
MHKQTKVHGIGATLVGVDKFGNKYYEKLGDTQIGRHRWVEYAKKDRYDASQVPPEWHGRLHCITDHTGDEASPFSPCCLMTRSEIGQGTNHGNRPRQSNL